MAVTDFLSRTWLSKPEFIFDQALVDIRVLRARHPDIWVRNLESLEVPESSNPVLFYKSIHLSDGRTLFDFCTNGIVVEQKPGRPGGFERFL